MTSPGRPEDRPLVERPDDDDYDLLTRNEATVRLREEIITLQQAVQAWNDFHLDEWCASAPDRFIPSGILPTWDIELAAPEARRLADRGFRAVSFPDSPVPLGMPPFHGNAWDPLWDVVSQEEICVCLHFGSSGFMPGFSFGSNIDPEPRPGGAAGSVRHRDRAVLQQPAVEHRGAAAVRDAAAVPEAAVHAVRGRDRLDPVHPGGSWIPVRPVGRSSA
jgi:hypothetical protein